MKNILVRRIAGIRGKSLVDVDGTSGALVTVDTIHRLIHLGKVFQASNYDPDLANNTDLDLLMVLGNRGAHARFHIAANGSCRVRLIEDSSIGDNGQQITAYNRNRKNPNQSASSIYINPTVNSEGETILDDLLAGGSAGGNRTIGSSMDSFEEFNLKTGTNYLLRVTNISGGNIEIVMSVFFYEP